MWVEILSSATLPTDLWVCTMHVWWDSTTSQEHVCLVYGDIVEENILMRIHSSCLTWECFLSKKCDCWPQLHQAMHMMQEAWQGVIIYLFQEWRGIWLVNKIKAYALQENWLDTVQANEQLWFPADARDYSLVVWFVRLLWIKSCRLLTNNPSKIKVLTDAWIQVNERVPLEIPSNHINAWYYTTKQVKMDHMFTNTIDLDTYYMWLALQEAQKCKNTLPNPRVGAVIVNNNEIVWRGYTQAYGWNHAEVEALHAAGDQAAWWTLYVTLEPCCYHGKTPPCTDAILNYGISKVVCAQWLDPNAHVYGHWIEILKKAHIQVKTWVLRDEALKINEDIQIYYEKKRPYILTKCAMTLDGKIATHTGDSKRITSDASRDITRHLRTSCQAILVWKNTVLHDDPHLWIRDEDYHDSLRIVLDSRLETSLDSQVYRDNNVIVVCSEEANEARVQEFENKGIHVLICGKVRVSLHDLMNHMYDKHITWILVEWGAEIQWSFFDEQLVDKIYIVQAPVIMWWKDASNAIWWTWVSSIANVTQIKHIERKFVWEDVHILWYPVFSEV